MPTLPCAMGRYTLMRELGRGGMGVVYVARDDRLGRDIAVKMIAGLADDRSVQRFWREARIAASVNHPHVCQIYEVDECTDGIYLAMELLQGEPLDARLARSALPPREAVTMTLQMLGALGALHERGLVHRDIKPSNVFLTPHGVKLLDFGLARSIADSTVAIDDSDAAITRPGMIVGTPRYMAPEQLRGVPVDARADLHAVGAVLFEMLTGRPLFAGDNVAALARAIVHDFPPALQGPPAVIAVDRVMRRALAKDPAARFPVAEAMAAELHAIQFREDDARALSAVRALVRLVVPPLRLQSEDHDTAFLSYGLAEAISGSLARLRDVAVRSPSVAANWQRDGDLRQLAAAADVDVVVSGSIARMGDQLRASLQLVDAREGTVVGGTSVRGRLSEIFAFEDELTNAVVALLTPLRAGASSASSGAEQRDVPANARAFEHFLRGLELARSMAKAPEARACFSAALDEDPAFAPAWAWLGRCHRVIGKYVENYEENDRRAEDAFRRALALSPDLPTAHRFYTHWESEHGRADAAIARLLQHSRANRNDAQLFAGLVHACRYAGLIEESLAAHEEARRLDPTVPTSVEYTLLHAGDRARLEALAGSTELDGVWSYVLLYGGHMEELRARLAVMDLDRHPPGYRAILEAARDALDSPGELLRRLDDTLLIGAKTDPEAVVLAGGFASSFGDDERAGDLIARAVDAGFSSLRVFEVTPRLRHLLDRPEVAAAGEVARGRQRIARAVFDRGGGRELLGLG